MKMTKPNAASAKRLVVAGILSLGVGAFALMADGPCTPDQEMQCPDICSSNGQGTYLGGGLCSSYSNICCACTNGGACSL